MRCRACELLLDIEDNYCRKCGAAVRVLDVTPVPQRAEVVRVGPSAPALLVGAAAPLATGAAAIAAGALMRFAIRRAMRGLVGDTLRSRPAAPARTTTQDTPKPAPGGATQVTEVFWYRRIVRS